MVRRSLSPTGTHLFPSHAYVVSGVQNRLFNQWESEYEKKGTANSCENERERTLRETDVVVVVAD
jgi:hypothetical protein